MKRNNVKQITIRLTADEYAHVKQLSKDSGLKMEPAIRRLIMGLNLRPRPPDEVGILRGLPLNKRILMSKCYACDCKAAAGRLQS